MDAHAKQRRKKGVADFVVLLLLAGFVGFYLIDAVRASTDILNLILILPVSLIVLVLCAIQFVLQLRAGYATDNEVPADEPGSANTAGGLAAFVLFAVYISTLEWLGFDIGTCLFLGCFLWLQGERRWPWLIGYSIAFGFALALFFSVMLPYPMPLLVLGLS